MKSRIFYTLMGSLTLVWAVAVVALPLSAVLFFLNNL